MNKMLRDVEALAVRSCADLQGAQLRRAAREWPALVKNRRPIPKLGTVKRDDMVPGSEYRMVCWGGSVESVAYLQPAADPTMILVERGVPGARFREQVWVNGILGPSEG